MNHTQLQSLTKSFEVSLIPTEDTKNYIDTHKIIEGDRLLAEQAFKVRPAIDEFLRDKITTVLESQNINFTALHDLYANALTLSAKKNKTKEEKQEAAEARQAYHQACDNIIETLSKAISKQIQYKLTSDAFLKNELIPFINTQSALPDADKEEIIDIITNVVGISILLKDFATSRKVSITNAAKRCIENFERYESNIATIAAFSQTPDYQELLTYFEDADSFMLPSYYEMLISPSGIAYYNAFINGLNNGDNTSVKGFNQLINEVNTRNFNNKGYHGPVYKKADDLHKQILMPAQKQFHVNTITSDEDLRDILTELETLCPVDKFQQIIDKIRTTDISQLTVHGNRLRTFSHIATTDNTYLYRLVEDNLRNELQSLLNTTKNKRKCQTIQGQLDNLSELINDQDYPLAELASLTDENIKAGYVSSLMAAYDNLKIAADALNRKKLVDSDAPIKKNKRNMDTIRDYLQAMSDMLSMARIIVPHNYTEENALFYNSYLSLMDEFNPVQNAYNLFRNYATRTPKDISKRLALNFGAPSYRAVASWWSGQNNILAKSENVLLKLNGEYYFGFVPADVPSCAIYEQAEDSSAYALCVKHIAKLFQNLPRYMIINSVKEQFADPAVQQCVRTESMNEPILYTREIYNIITRHLYRMDEVVKAGYTEAEARVFFAKYVAFLQEFLDKYSYCSDYGIKLADPSTYKNAGALYDDIDRQALAYEWRPLSYKHIMELNRTGKLLLFKLYTKNMYKEDLTNAFDKTFKYLLSDANFKNKDIQLNSRPTVYYREATVEDAVTHAAGSVLVNRVATDGTTLPRKLYFEAYNYLNGKIHKDSISNELRDALIAGKIRYTTATKDIIKDRRYSKDAYFLKMSYVLNRTVTNKPQQAESILYNSVNEELKHGSKKLVLHRGTENLVYAVLVDESGTPVMSKSFNVLRCGNRDVDFAQRLKELSKQRITDKEDKWVYDTQIKNNRTTYLEMVAAEVAKIAIANNAVIVMEKVSPKLKQKKSAFDAQAFTAFENILATKLAAFTDPTLDYGEAGSVNNPIQNAVLKPGSEFRNGVIFYEPAGYTASICPITGFSNLFDLHNIKSLKDKREFLKRFKAISYNEVNESFMFDFVYGDFENLRVTGNDILMQHPWTVQAGGTYSLFNREIKAYQNTEPAPELYAKMRANGYTGELTEVIDVLPSDDIEQLYDLFANRLKFTTLHNDGKSKYVSPIVGACSESPDYYAAIMLGKKFDFARNYVSSKMSDFTTDWLCSITQELDVNQSAVINR